MEEKTIYNFLIKNDLEFKPSGSRIKAYVKCIQEVNPRFRYKNVNQVIENACKDSEKIFPKLHYAIADDKDEIIHRNCWDFSKLVGCDKKFLKDELFEFAFMSVLNTFQKSHDVLVVVEPFRKKPYSQNKNYEFLESVKDRVDVCVISEIGVVPLYPRDYSNLYPFRYFNYQKKEQAKSPLKYNTKMLEKFIRHFGYKYVLFIGSYQSFNPFMHDLYFNISMDLNVNTDWIWAFKDCDWYKISEKYGSLVGFSYPNDPRFKEIVKKKVDQAFKFTKEYH